MMGGSMMQGMTGMGASTMPSGVAIAVVAIGVLDLIGLILLIIWAVRTSARASR